MDVTAVFLKPLPWAGRLKGELWRVEVMTVNKSGKQVAIVATCATDGRSHTLWRSHRSMLDGALTKGILIRGGTPARGVVTELRRAGCVSLRAARGKSSAGAGPMADMET